MFRAIRKIKSNRIGHILRKNHLLKLITKRDCRDERRRRKKMVWCTDEFDDGAKFHTDSMKSAVAYH